MAEKNNIGIYEPEKQRISEYNKQIVMERLWLTYFNDTLFSRGVITEDEHNRMRVKIKTRISSAGLS